MKKLPITGIISLLAVASLAATFTLTIEPSPTPGVTYRIYSSTNAGSNWKFELATTNLIVVLSNRPVPIDFSVSAANSNGESGKVTSEPLYRPTNVKIVEQ